MTYRGLERLGLWCFLPAAPYMLRISIPILSGVTSTCGAVYLRYRHCTAKCRYIYFVGRRDFAPLWPSRIAISGFPLMVVPAAVPFFRCGQKDARITPPLLGKYLSQVRSALGLCFVFCCTVPPCFVVCALCALWLCVCCICFTLLCCWLFPRSPLESFFTRVSWNPL